MEIRKPKIKSIPYGEFKDNDTLRTLAEVLNPGGTNVVLGNLYWAINWGRSNSLWSLTFGTSCCGIEFMAVGCARYDFSRFGFEVTRNSPRQADIIMCAGTITNKMAPVFKRLYDEMAEPKYVVAVGGCTISGGPFKSSYYVVRGIDELVPVDVYIPGCPPRPEAILYGMMQLQRKVKIERFFGGANHKMNVAERRESMEAGGLHGLSNENLAFEKLLHQDDPIIVKDGVTKEQVDQLGKELDQLSEREKEQTGKENVTPAPAQPDTKPVDSSKETNKNQGNTPAA